MDIDFNKIDDKNYLSKKIRPHLKKALKKNSQKTTETLADYVRCQVIN